MFVSIGKLSSGKTYTITIAAGSIAKAGDAAVTNSKISFQFVVPASAENLYYANLTTPGDLNNAPLTTRLVVTCSEKVQAKEKVNGSDVQKTYYATIEGHEIGGEGTYGPFTMGGAPNDKSVVFTPGVGNKFMPGYTYTLTFLGDGIQVENKDEYFKDKVFTFSTMTPVGKAPEIQSTTPSEGTLFTAEQANSDGEFVITFTDEINLIDGWQFLVTPVNGSEGKTYDATNNSAQVTLEGNKLTLKYKSGDFKNNLVYDLLIPVYSIAGAGGQAMDYGYDVHFQMPRKSGVKDSRSKKNYYTWDFTKMSETTYNNLMTDATSSTTKHGWQTVNKNNASTYFDADKTVYGFSNYINSGKGLEFNQSEEVNDGTRTWNEGLGLWFSLAKSTADRRFSIMNSKEVSNYTADGWSLKITGNTQYMTIPDVPKGKLYIIANINDGNGFFNINSNNAVFVQNGEKDKNDQVRIGKKGADLGKAVYIVDVQTAGDVSFCMGDVRLYKIAISPVSKKFMSKFEGYATDCQPYQLRYDLTNDFTTNPVQAYVVKSVDSAANNAPGTEVKCAPNATGTILKATLGDASEMTLPLFVADVNTAAEDVTGNMLVGVLTATNIKSTQEDGNYIFTNVYYRYSNEDKTAVDPDSKKTVSMGFYNTVAGSIAANKSYLRLGKDAVASAKQAYIMFNFMDEATGVDRVSNEAANDHAPYYTIQGVKLNGKPTTSGIYIHNGKKIIIKK